jgi:hypothetical protein
MSVTPRGAGAMMVMVLPDNIGARACARTCEDSGDRERGGGHWQSKMQGTVGG